MDLTDSDATYCEEIEIQKHAQKIELKNLNQSHFISAQNQRQSALNEVAFKAKERNPNFEMEMVPSSSQSLTRSQQKQNLKPSEKSSKREIQNQQDNPAILENCREKLKEIRARIMKKDISYQESQLLEKELADIKKKVSDKRIRNSVDSTYLKLCEVVEHEGTSEGEKCPSTQDEFAFKAKERNPNFQMEMFPSSSQSLTRSQQKQNLKPSEKSSKPEIQNQQDDQVILDNCREKLKEIRARIMKKDISYQESQLLEKELADIKKKVSDKRIRNSVDSTYLKLCEVVEHEGTSKGEKRPSTQEESARIKRKREEINNKSSDNSDALSDFNIEEWDGITDAQDLTNSLLLAKDDSFEIYKKQTREELRKIQEMLINAKAFIDSFSQDDYCTSKTPTKLTEAQMNIPSTSRENPLVLVTNTKSESLSSYSPDNLNVLPSTNNSSFDESEPLKDYEDISFGFVKHSTPLHTPFSEGSDSFNLTRDQVSGQEEFFDGNSDDENQQQPEDYSYEEVAPVQMQTNQKEENNDSLLIFSQNHLCLLADRLSLSENFLRVCILETYREAVDIHENMNGEISDVPLQTESTVESDLEAVYPQCNN